MKIIVFGILGAVLLGLCILVICVILKSKKQPKGPSFGYIQGTIKECSETTVVIHYTVNDKTYKLTEVLRTKEEAIKVGEVTVGHKQVPITKAYVGQSVAIAYNIKDHKQAFWVANRNTNV